MEEPPLSPLPEQELKIEPIKGQYKNNLQEIIDAMDRQFHNRLQTVLSGGNDEEQAFLVLRDDIICIPRREIDWKRFRSLASFMADELERYGAISSNQYVSIYALDGAVAGKTRTDLGLSNKALLYRLVNINHHSCEDEEGTPSTAKQIWEKIKNGAIKSDPKEHRRILVDDPDPDVQLSVYLLGHADELLSDLTKKERMEKFVALQDQLDVHAGICSVDFADQEQELLFRHNIATFQHYFDARRKGLLLNKDGNIMLDIIGKGVANIDGYINQHPEHLETVNNVVINKEHTEIQSEPGKWIIIDEAKSGTFARLALSKWYDIVISKRIHADGHAYSIVRSTKESMKDVNLLTMLAPSLNEAERLKGHGSEDIWGGRSNVLGSFRTNLSRLSDNQVIEKLLLCNVIT